ncbi:MAG TPA: hypothetical protein VL084_08765, partial [Thermoanaerobaculia bacterium]|nr:hypothetical protein [Thermoanaerobaculia bacterium]
MDEAASRLADRVAELADSLRRLEARVAALEGSAADAAPAPVAAAPPPVVAEVPRPEPLGPQASAAEFPGFMALAGRALVLLGGAYLFRALTDAHVLPAGIGVALGLLYAAVLLVLTDRAAGSGNPHLATAYAAVSTAVACPLAWEATTRLGVFRPGTGVAVLGAAGTLLLAEAARRRLPAAAGLAVLGLVGAGFAILISNFALEAVLGLLLFAATIGVVAATLRGWPELAWPGALAADFLALMAAFIAGRAGGLPENWASVSLAPLVALLVALPVLSLSLTLWRTVVRKADPEVFDFVQPSLGVLAGIGAAALIGPRVGVSPVMLGVAVLAAAVLLFALDTLRPVSRQVSALQTTTGAVLVVAGGFLAVPGPFRAAFWSAAAVGAATAFLRIPRKTRAAQTAVFVAASSLAAGLLPGAADFLLGGSAPAAPSPLAAALPALAAALVAYAILATRLAPGTFRWREDLPAVAVGTIAVLDIATVFEGSLERLLFGGGDPGGGSALRTITVSAAAILLAGLRRRRFAAPVGFLVYPLLAVGGLRIVLFDLMHGRP